MYLIANNERKAEGELPYKTFGQHQKGKQSINWGARSASTPGLNEMSKWRSWTRIETEWEWEWEWEWDERGGSL